MSSDQSTQPEALAIEDDPVVRWRLGQFTVLGFSEDQAWLLAASDADLHLTRTLVAAGCPLELAVRIVL